MKWVILCVLLLLFLQENNSYEIREDGQFPFSIHLDFQESVSYKRQKCPAIM